MQIGLDTQLLHLFAEEIRRRLIGVLGDDNAADLQPHRPHVVDGAQQVQIVGDAEIGSDFFLFDVRRIDAEDNFALVAEFLQ